MGYARDALEAHPQCAMHTMDCTAAHFQVGGSLVGVQRCPPARLVRIQGAPMTAHPRANDDLEALDMPHAGAGSELKRYHDTGFDPRNIKLQTHAQMATCMHL